MYLSKLEDILPPVFQVGQTFVEVLKDGVLVVVAITWDVLVEQNQEADKEQVAEALHSAPPFTGELQENDEHNEKLRNNEHISQCTLY